jgi:hypothetical protein
MRPKHLMELASDSTVRLNRQQYRRGRLRRLHDHSKSFCYTSPDFRSPDLFATPLPKDAIFEKRKFPYQQTTYVCDIEELQHNLPVSINALAKPFERPRSRVKSALGHGMNSPGHRGKHTALEQDHEQQILDWIKQNAEDSTPVTRKEIKDYRTSQFQVPMTRGSVKSFVLRSLDENIQEKGSLQEEQRLQVP